MYGPFAGAVVVLSVVELVEWAEWAEWVESQWLLELQEALLKVPALEVAVGCRANWNLLWHR